MSTTCPCCVEEYNKSIRSEIKCPKCSYSTCKECTRTYILSTTKDPCCMNCYFKFPSEFNVLQLNRSFMEKDYKKHRQTLLLEREISKMPETMPLAQQQQEVEEIEGKNNELKKEITALREKARALENEKNSNHTKIWNIKAGKTKKSETKFIMPCPDEICRGYLSTGYKCGICNLCTCPKCLEIVGDKKVNPLHVCDEEKVKTAEFIKSTTKPCPGCGERIFKLEGCDQMWCTGCHTAFSWKTGVVDKGLVHNPHFYQFQRNNQGGAPRNPMDFHCGGMPNWWVTRREITQCLLSHISQRTNGDIVSVLTNLHRTVTHITYISLADTRRKIQELSNLQDLRVRYILKRISKKELATTILRKDNLRRKYTEMVHVFELLSTVGIDIFNMINEKVKKLKINLEKNTRDAIAHEFADFSKKKINEYKKLCEYCNSQLEVISVTFNQTVVHIDDSFIIKTIKFSLTKHKLKQEKENFIIAPADIN